MDVTATDVPVNLESVEMTSVVEGKRDGEENGDVREESVDPPCRKPRFDEEVNRVAEIVLVLSALRRIRGGKSPTESELELMEEAKSKLTDMCQEFNPKDIIGRDAVGAVIEDLGLNGKLKDQRLGFRAPKLTISEKLSLGKRKMEESKKHPIVSTSYISPGHSTTTNNVSVTHHWPNSELKASTSSANATANHFVRDASGITQSRMERPQFKSDIHAGASQGPAVTTGNYFGNATTWSAQPHSSSTISFGPPSDTKVPLQSSSRVTDPSFRPFMSQTPPATFQGMKGVNYGQTSSSFGNNHHAEIAKIIHKVLQPRAKQNLSWNPPSREYMSRAIQCQMCQGIVNEVDTVLICDACEKGYHLKCLQANNMKGVPKSEWHCSRCVQIYNGKPFPPKYGRVMRSATTAKMSSSSSEVQLPAERKVGNKMNLKVNQEAARHPEKTKPTEDTAATEQKVEAEDAAMNPTVEAEDTAMKEADDANNESQGTIGNGAAIKQADGANNESQGLTGNDAAMDEADDTNNESEDPVGNDAECGDPAEPVSDSETPNTPKLENREDPSKDDTERSVSENCQDENSKMIAEPSLQEENSASQTENSKTIAEPESPLQSNTDHSQEQDTTPNVEEGDIQKRATENPQEDRSC